MNPLKIARNIKRFFRYYTNPTFINQQQSAIKFLDEMINELNEDPNFDGQKSLLYQFAQGLRNDIGKCWSLTEITKLINKEISTILWKENKINIQVFDLRTNWFLWQNIFLHVDAITNATVKESAKTRLNILLKISSNFDLGK